MRNLELLEDSLDFEDVLEMSGLGLPQRFFSVSGLLLLDRGIQFPLLLGDDDFDSFLLGPKPFFQLFLNVDLWFLVFVLCSLV